MRLGLVFGGRSGEHDVSVVSARSVAAALDRTRFDVVPMAIDRAGRWADAETAESVLAGSGDRTDEVRRFQGSAAFDQRLLEGALDVVFPVLHGPYGEDGTIQGLFEMLDLPYVGSGVEASALCMDKAMAKRVIVQAGLPTPPWVELTVLQWAEEREEARARCLDLGLPLFVKPARLGSSVGISKVSELTALEAAVAKALELDAKVVVERGITGREIEVAVLGNERPRAAIPGEVVPGHDFYDYEDKYVDDACELLAPAPLESGQMERARELAVAAFSTLGCEGMARVDLFLDSASGAFLVNEVNTIPGFTSISMYPRLWDVSGLPYGQLLEQLVDLALERHHRRHGGRPGG
ncbi:MAG: D-alanine--D-alanine ligase [Acidobacteria bacterium]|nr:D-alanine--D-alanine ligase [Acidobacteriota bacterium]